MIKKNIIYILFSVFFVYTACEKQEILQTEPHYKYNYFPIDSGLWRQYIVEQIVIDETTNIRDTSIYQLREVCAGNILNASNDTVMRVERFIRKDDNDKWKILSVWQAEIKGRDAFQTEENIKYLKIKFPIKINIKWNGDAYNTTDSLQQYLYRVESVDVRDTINNFVFDSVLKIVQKDKSSIVDKVYFFEKYAMGVGMVEKQQIDIYSTDVDPLIPIEDRITKGTIYRCKLISYGKN
jgi:hypothetical protein